MDINIIVTFKQQPSITANIIDDEKQEKRDFLYTI